MACVPCAPSDAVKWSPVDVLQYGETVPMWAARAVTRVKALKMLLKQKGINAIQQNQVAMGVPTGGEWVIWYMLACHVSAMDPFKSAMGTAHMA